MGGEVFRLFDSVEQLAAVLRSQKETECRTKEFLKNTISDISHQLKTPLAALAMYQEIIEDEPDNTEIVKKFNGKIGAALKRMEQLISSMLKITRLDTGNINFEKTACLVKGVVENAVNELTTRAVHEKKQIIINGNPEQTVLCDMGWTSEAVCYKTHYKPSFAVVKNLHGIRSQMFIQLFVKGEHGCTVQRVVGDR